MSSDEMKEVGRESVIQLSDIISISSSAVYSCSSSVAPSPKTPGLPIHYKDIPTNPQEAWFPITASRNGNAYFSAFHCINSGIGFQALLLPMAFTVLGWTWGVISLSVAFVWQFYTIWLLVQLHESVPGKRYDRYLLLSKAAFGQRLGKLLVLFPLMYLSGATCVMLIMTAGDCMNIFMKVNETQPLTTVECYVLFVCLAIALALLLPNLNSIAWISFVGASAAVLYCTLLWSISITKGKPSGISYNPITPKSEISRTFSVFNALGTIALAFRGHNLILEIQATMPSREKILSCVPMSRGVNFAYLVIFLCLYPLAIIGFWAYGDMIANQGGMLNALHTFHGHDTSRFLLNLTTLLAVVHCLCSYQIYAVPTIDNLTFAYIRKKKKPCPKWVPFAFRILFGCLTLFIAIALPFIRSLGGLIGGIALPVTMAYPCFMWIVIKKPCKWSSMWCINMVIGSFGVVLSVLVFAGGIWTLIYPGIYVRFFRA